MGGVLLAVALADLQSESNSVLSVASAPIPDTLPEAKVQRLVSWVLYVGKSAVLLANGREISPRPRNAVAGLESKYFRARDAELMDLPLLAAGWSSERGGTSI